MSTSDAPPASPEGTSSTPAYDTFDSERVVLVVEHFVSRFGGACELHKLANACAALKRLLCGRRLLTFLLTFKDRFDITSNGGGGQTVRILRTNLGTPPDHIVPYLTFAQEGQYTVELLTAMKKGVDLYTQRQHTTGAPLRWLFAHKAIPKLVKGWAGGHPVPEYQYQGMKDLGGFGGEQAAKSASLLRYLQHFVDLNPEVLRWDESIATEEGTQLQVKLAENAGQVMKRVAGDAPPSKRRKIEQSADTTLSMDTVADVSGIVGKHLLVTRVSTRAKEMNKLEVRLLAEWAGLAHFPSEVRSGLWCIDRPETDAAVSRFTTHLDNATSVRRCCLVLCVSEEMPEDCPQFASAIHTMVQQRYPNDASFKIDFESHYPEARPATLPFTDMSAHATLLSTVFTAVGVNRIVDTPTTTLVLISVKGLLLLAEQPAQPTAGMAPLAQRVVAFNKRWEGRPFSFSGAMDVGVASTVVAVARLAYAVGQGGGGGSPKFPDVVLDACCGSGTIACAASVQGARGVIGFETRADFVGRVAENLTHCAIHNVSPLCHDCTQPFTPSVDSAPPLPEPDMVICNAPWGKKFGTENDCETVLRGVLARNPSTPLICFIAPKAVMDKVRDDTELNVIASVPLGTVSLILIKQGITGLGQPSVHSDVAF